MDSRTTAYLITNFNQYKGLWFVLAQKLARNIAILH